jgi:hypothetical protein
MALILMGFCVVLLGAASANAQTNEPDTCVRDARAALDAQSLEAFGPEATVQKQKSIETVETEALEEIERSALTALRSLLGTYILSGSSSSASFALVTASYSSGRIQNRGQDSMGARDMYS